MIDKKELIASIATQDQEWSEACAWLRESDLEEVAILVVASVADDPKALIRVMEDWPECAAVVQRMVALVLVEAAQRNIEAVT